mgnify:CR=1 FL=1
MLLVDFGRISRETLDESSSGKQSQNDPLSNFLDYDDDNDQCKTYIPESESESSEEKTRKKQTNTIVSHDYSDLKLKHILKSIPTK